MEDALRHMTDYAYLGDHIITQFKLVKSKVAVDAVTHLDLGKAAYDVLTEAIEKLRPTDDIPSSEPPPREWYPYLILHGAYVQDIVQLRYHVPSIHLRGNLQSHPPRGFAGCNAGTGRNGGRSRLS